MAFTRLQFGYASPDSSGIVSIARLILSVLILLSLSAFRFIVNTFPPNEQGMFCDDDSIRRPFRENTVPSLHLWIIVFMGTFIVLLVVELINARIVSKSGVIEIRQISGYLAIHPTIFYLLFFFGIYIFGLLVCDSLVHVGKLTVGRLRPNFVAVCHPNVTSCQHNPSGYISQIHCLGSSDPDGRMSFPSGHAAVSFYAAVFLMVHCLQLRSVLVVIFQIYLHHRLPLPSLSFVRSLLQVVLFMLAYFCALSRIRDNKHRISDVFVGVFIGTTTAIITTVFIIGRLFSSRYLPINNNQEQMGHSSLFVE